MKKTLLLPVFMLLTIVLSAQQFPFQNPDLSFEERARDLIMKARAHWFEDEQAS